MHGIDVQYLETLTQIFAGGPVGIQAIAHVMKISAETLENDIEPPLLRSGAIYRIPWGRCAGPKAYEILDMTAPLDYPGDSYSPF